MAVANTQAYYNTATRTSIKSFIVQAQGSLRKKLFCCKYYSRTVTYSVWHNQPLPQKSEIFDKARIPLEWSTLGLARASPADVRLGYEWLAKITTVKSFVEQAPRFPQNEPFN
jgi:hypothetical protein